MAELGSGKRATGKLRFRAVFTEDALSSNTPEVAGRLFARWVARGFAPKNPETLDPAQGRASDTGREGSEGAAPARHLGRTGRTQRTHST